MTNDQITAQTLPKSTQTILWFVTLALLAGGFVLRMVDLTDQPIDFHPTRQLRGAIVARGIYYSLLPPNPNTAEQALKTELATNFRDSTGQYEPSIVESLVAILYLLAGGEYIWIARIITSLFWTIGGYSLFLLARRILTAASPLIAWLSALVSLAYYLFLPFAVQASRSFQPDPGMVMWLILAVYALYRWSDSRGEANEQKPDQSTPPSPSFPAAAWKWAVLAGLFGGIAILSKIVAGYIMGILAPVMVIYTLVAGGQSRSTSVAPSSQPPFLKRLGTLFLRILRDPQVWVMIVLMLLPVGIFYMGRGGRASEYFSGWTLALSHLLTQPATYVRWLSLVENLMGLTALLLAFLGALIAPARGRALLLGLWAGYFVYGLFLPYQMYTHNYYHLQLVPIIALSLAPVAELVIERLASEKHALITTTVWRILAAGVALAFLMYTAWLSIFSFKTEDFRGEPAYWAEIASHLPEDSKILALTQDYGYPLMYYGWRKVDTWPTRGENQLAELRQRNRKFDEYFAKRIEGKDFFLVTAFKQFEDQPVLKETLYERFPILDEGPGYIIFDLGQR